LLKEALMGEIPLLLPCRGYIKAAIMKVAARLSLEKKTDAQHTPFLWVYGVCVAKPGRRSVRNTPIWHQPAG
jgi:hypothetical protein